MNTARKIASILLKTRAVKLSPQKPFQWSSGWNSPIYCDNRITLSDVEARTFIKKALAKAIKKEFPDATAIAGVATAGIAQGALVADYLRLPFAYVRPRPKDHGMGNQIEGRMEPGSKVVVLEDLVSTGGSSIKAAEALQAQGIEVLGMMAIFTYGFKAAEKNFAEKQLKLVTLSNYAYLIDEAVKQSYVNPDDLDLLQKWRRKPETF